MKKLLLVLPRNERGFWGKVSDKGKTGFVRLSLPILAGITPKDWEVEILDARAHPVNYDARPDLVGITAFTAEAPSAYSIADGFRAKGVPVVMGGMHASALPEEALLHADAVVVGEAEPVWEDLLKDLENGELKSIYTSKSQADMDKIPIPRRDLLDRKMYVSCFNTIQATRGCPHNCDYCAVSAFFGRRYRTRSIGRVLEEIRGIDTRDFFFVDDNVIARPDYAKELFRELIPMKKAWGGQTSINLAKDEELLELYARSGGKYAFIGFETLSPKNLKKMKKSWNSPESYSQAIKKIHDAGINILASFMFGLDDDDPSVFQHTLDFINENKLDAAQFHILTPFPGTALFDRMDAEGRITDKDWAKYHTGEVIFKPQGMTTEQLQNGYYWIFRQTYTLPNILKRSLRSPKNLTYRLGMNYTYRKKALRMPNPAHP